MSEGTLPSDTNHPPNSPKPHNPFSSAHKTWVSPKTYAVVVADGTGVNPGYRVASSPSYQGIKEDFSRTFRVLDSLKPDIWLTPHNEVYGFDAKLNRTTKEGAAAWVDPDGYKKWVQLQRGKFEAALMKESR